MTIKLALIIFALCFFWPLLLESEDFKEAAAWYFMLVASVWGAGLL